MGRRKFKYSPNNLRSNRVIPKFSGHTIGRLDHSNIEEADKNDFKRNFMKMMETFKEEVKNHWSLISLNINVLNSPIKRHRLREWI